VGTPRIPYARLESSIAGVLRATGMSEEHAGVTARALAMTDLRGVHSHGTAQLTGYVRKLQRGEIDPHGTPRVVHRHGSIAVLDGGGCIGHVAAEHAMRLATDLAEGSGIAAVAVRGTNHLGAAGHFARIALERDMVGIILTTAMPTMAPAGGRERVLGMNPIGVAIPAGDEPAVVLDAAFAAAARGRVMLAHQAGRPLPDGWARDRDGNPTTDPVAALSGLLEPIGGVKGAGLSVVFGLLASAFAGAAFGPDLGDVEAGPTPGVDGSLAIVIDPAAFGTPEDFSATVANGTRMLRDSAPRTPGERVLLPGDRAAAATDEGLAQGVLLPDSTYDELRALCDELDVPFHAGT
jgi:LDH2 family malate/lactate/ureidoglycolate dehydrogenase